MIRQQSVGWMALLLISLGGAYVMGQDEGAAELYGRGVHAYFAGDYDLAIALLSESIEKHASDPRAYYFRGLALANTSGVKAGLADMAKGADVEVNQADRPVYDINGALQRVQGPLRGELESVRAATRKAALERKKKRDQVRYEELKRREDVVLFDPSRPAPQVRLNLPAPDLAGKEDPFQSGVAFSGGRQVDYVAPTPVEPAGAPATAATDSQPRDPFGEAAVAKPAEPVDPFGSPDVPAKPARQPAAKSAAPTAEANPFGENMPKLELEGAEKPAAPAANLGGGLIDLLGRTISGQAGDRDPFGEPDKEQPAPGDQPDKKPGTPPADTPGPDPFDTPEAKPAPGDQPDKKPDTPPADAPGTDPFDTPEAKPAPGDQPDKKPDTPPAGQDADPFK